MHCHYHNKQMIVPTIDVKKRCEKNKKNVKKRKKRGKNKKTFKNVIKNVDATVI